MMNPTETDILIIGAGPVGLTLAGELARHGATNVRVVEKRPARTAHSNALIVHVRTRETLDAMGTQAEFARRGYPAGDVVITAFGRRVAAFRMDGVDSPHSGPLILAQSETEEILQGHLESLGGRVDRGVEAVRVEPDADGVNVTLHHGETGAEETVRTRWLVGCEGSNSLTRKGNQIPFEGERYAGEEFLMGDFTLRWGFPTGRMQVFVEADRTLMIFPFDARNDFTRVLLARRDQDPANREAPTLEELQEVIRAMTGDPEATLTNDRWRTRWRSQHRLAGRLREGRCLLAGDAGHVHVPVGGQGMNYGIQDAFNLGWKLAAVVRGEGPESLLDTYAAERHATASQLVAGTDRAYRSAINPGAVTSFLMRHVLPAALSLDAVQDHVRTLMAELNVAYSESPLTEEHGGHHHGAARAGERAPDAPVTLGAVREPGRLFDHVLCGTHWTLLLFSGEQPDADRCGRLAALGEEAAKLGNVHAHVVFRAPVSDVTVPDDALLDFGGELHARYGVTGGSAALCLVRPDWYVGFRGRLEDADALRAYLGRVFRV